MIEVVTANDQRQIDFDRNFGFLRSSGIMDILYEVGRGHEGLNDETLWQYQGRQFQGSSEVRIDVRKPRRTEGGLETKHVRVVFDGRSLRISGKSSSAFSMPVGSDIQDETKNGIREAIERCFQEPEVTFISTEDLYSSD